MEGVGLFLEFFTIPPVGADSLCGPWFACLTMGVLLERTVREGPSLPSVPSFCGYARQWLDIPRPLETPGCHYRELEKRFAWSEEDQRGLAPFWERHPHAHSLSCSENSDMITCYLLCVRSFWRESSPTQDS